MKISKVLSSFLALLILNSTFSTNFILKTSQNEKKLSNYVCKVIKEITKAKNDTQDVLIGNLSGKLWSSTVNDIAGCVGQEAAVVLSDFKMLLKEKTLRKAAVIIIALSSADHKIVNFLVNVHKFSKVSHHMAKFIIIVPKDTKFDQRFKLINSFIAFGFQNVVCVHETANHDIQWETYFSLDNKKSVELNDVGTELIFPDKLRNMFGYPYKVYVYSQIPKLIISHGRPLTPLAHFMSAVQKIQNATVLYKVLKHETLLKNVWMDRLMDLTLNTGYKFYTSEPKLMTYEDSGYCALIPLPSETSYSQLIFIKPFDGLTWLFLALTMACSVTVWWMFQGRGAVDSPRLLVYGMFVMFIGQGVDFSRKNRLVLIILLQLIIVMIWILCNAYEGVITSFMIQPIQEERMLTFDDLVASDYEIITDEVFTRAIRDTGIYKSLMMRLNSSGNQLRDELKTEIPRQHYVFIMNCDIAEIMIDIPTVTGKIVSNFYYLLPEKMFSYLEELEASFFNPYVERLQYFMDLSFQAGLMHIWKVMSPENRFFERFRQSSSEQTYLELKDFVVVFCILMAGCALSLGLFIIEIFFHDIIQKLELANLARNLKNQVHQMAYKKRKQPKHPKYQRGALYYIIHRHKRVKRLKARKLKVRRIYVQPRFPMD
ncbi:unnamed protein product [Chironomus riparius]|uniref:Ionotropic receptor n=1 Tax=Chironomus riparius TaxID=315576 RepID=A0A9N9WYK0_9DIPT|nr:unnamed protein product [Chironomus riparius]